MADEIKIRNLPVASEGPHGIDWSLVLRNAGDVALVLSGAAAIALTFHKRAYAMSQIQRELMSEDNSAFQQLTPDQQDIAETIAAATYLIRKSENNPQDQETYGWWNSARRKVKQLATATSDYGSGLLLTLWAHAKAKENEIAIDPLITLGENLGQQAYDHKNQPNPLS